MARQFVLSLIQLKNLKIKVCVRACVFVCVCVACADPESFARGGPTQLSKQGFYLFSFVFMRGGGIQKTIIAGHYRSASKTPFNGVSLAGR